MSELTFLVIAMSICISFIAALVFMDSEEFLCYFNIPVKIIIFILSIEVLLLWYAVKIVFGFIFWVLQFIFIKGKYRGICMGDIFYNIEISIRDRWERIWE